MDFLVDSVRRRLVGSRSKSRSLPLYTKAAPESGPEFGYQHGETAARPLSPLEKRISSSSPKLVWTPQQQQQQQQERRVQQQSKRRNSSSCLPTSGQRSDSDGSPSDTTSCSSMEFMPGSSFKAPVKEPPDIASAPKALPSCNRRERLEALKARVTAQRNKYKNDSSSSSSASEGEEEERPVEVPGRLTRFHSDEALHRAGRGRASRRAKRRSQDLEAMARAHVTRSDPQLLGENRSTVTWQESSAYLDPAAYPRRLRPEDGLVQSASEDAVPAPRPATVPPPSRCAVRKPLTVSVHGLHGHFPPASPCDSGLGSHSMTSSPSLGRAPTPPLRVTKSEVHRLPPSLRPAPEPSASVWWRKKQGLSDGGRTEASSPRSPARVYTYDDRAPRPSAYLSDSQAEPVRNHSEEFNRRLGAWKAMETASARKPEAKSNGEGRLLVDVCRTRSVVWPKDFSNGVSRSPALDGSPRSSPPVWAKKETPDGLPSGQARSFTPVPSRSESSCTPKSSPVPPRLWSPPVHTRSPNRISAAEALGVTPAIPLPPTRVGSLDTARRNVDALAEKERRRRCSEHLEDALQELETIYQSLRLNEDEELLDRAERRDMPEWRPAGAPRWQKRFSIADPTGGFPLVRSFSDGPSRLRRSAVPDRVADDLAVRKLQQRPSAPPRNGLSADSVPSYLLCSPAHTPSLNVKPATRDVTCTNEPDPELDDVGYRKFAQSYRQPPPHPPFGIPLDPSPGTPSTSYIYAENTTETVPDWRSSKKNVQADPMRDDLAYRNLRRESLLRSGSRRSVSALSDLEDWARPRDQSEYGEDSMASIIAALEGLGQKSPPPVPKRRSVPASGQRPLHGLTLRA